jgi:hypothetical protein
MEDIKWYEWRKDLSDYEDLNLSDEEYFELYGEER